ISIGLTLALLRPLRAMTLHLTSATADLKNLTRVSNLPPSILRFTSQFWSRADDFAALVSSIQRLIERINANYKLTKSWTFQMAHEIKTPLTLIRSEIERQQKEKKISDEAAGNVIGEVDTIAEVITQFLDWADIENSDAAKEIHAVR